MGFSGDLRSDNDIYVLNIIKTPVTYVYNIGIFTVKKILESFFQILIHHRDAPS